MAELWSRLVQGISQRLADLSAGKKIVLALTLGMGVAALVVAILWLKRPQYQPLFTNLNPDDAGSVTAKLKEDQVPYRLEDGGRSILVPAERVYDIRLELAGQGLPQGGGVGFEIFDRHNLGTTEFVQKLNYRRALQGELARTISQLEEVDQARVHLVIPEKALFVQDQETASASVVLKLEPGREIKGQQIQGIVHLVSSSVEGLKPERITIIDQRGRILSSGSGESDLQKLTSSQLEYQRLVEREMERQIQSMLEQVLGPQKVIARVSAAMDFDRIERTEESYDPDTTVVRSEQRSNETSNGAGPVPMGVPGVQSNLPGGTPGSSSASPSQYKRENETINYEISKVTRHVIEPMGKIRRLSVAVLIDGKYRPLPNKPGEQEYLPRSPEELSRYQSIVKKAVGYSEERKDQVEVASFPFETTRLAWEGAEEKGKGWEYGRMVLPYGFVLLLCGLIFFFLIRPLIRWLTVPVPVSPRITRELPPTVEELEAALLPGAERALGEPLRERVLRLADADPVRTAQMIRNWLR
ncbi:MAG: flagellar M-ring protein FliF, partial [Candidatus Tectomicrobia bacterium]|nr:flagellar M-ring protein FliF [Candidatus Tectomicrobia bacterium]